MHSTKRVRIPISEPIKGHTTAHVVPPQSGLKSRGWQWIAVAFVAVVAFAALVLALQHTSQKFHFNALSLDDTTAQLEGTLEFHCSKSRIFYRAWYSVPPAETVTRLRLEYADDVGPDSPDEIPLCRNDALDPVNPHQGPPCPSQVPCTGQLCYKGTLSGTGSQYVVVEERLCRQLEVSETLLRVRMYTDLHASGIAVGGLARHATT